MATERAKINYKPLWKLLIDRDISKQQLREKTSIARSTMVKMVNNEYVAMDVLVRICLAMDCGMDDIVEVYFEEDDETEKIKIVSTMRGDSIKGRISSESPIGSALMGHKVGDRVEIKVNDNYSYFVVVKSIENTGEEETDTIRAY